MAGSSLADGAVFGAVSVFSGLAMALAAEAIREATFAAVSSLEIGSALGAASALAAGSALGAAFFLAGSGFGAAFADFVPCLAPGFTAFL